jgi:hypothetical protein
MLWAAFGCGTHSRAKSVPAIGAKLDLIGVERLGFLRVHPIILSREGGRGERDSGPALRDDHPVAVGALARKRGEIAGVRPVEINLK